MPGPFLTVIQQLLRIIGIDPPCNFRDISSDLSTAARFSSAYRGSINDAEALFGLMAGNQEPELALGKTMVVI